MLLQPAIAVELQLAPFFDALLLPQQPAPKMPLNDTTPSVVTLVPHEETVRAVPQLLRRGAAALHGAVMVHGTHVLDHVGAETLQQQ
jgi:hypothetical protein